MWRELPHDEHHGRFRVYAAGVTGMASRIRHFESIDFTEARQDEQLSHYFISLGRRFGNPSSYLTCQSLSTTISRFDFFPFLLYFKRNVGKQCCSFRPASPPPMFTALSLTRLTARHLSPQASCLVTFTMSNATGGFIPPVFGFDMNYINCRAHAVYYSGACSFMITLHISTA